MDPDRLCLGCMNLELVSGSCPACGFQEQASSSLALPLRTVLYGQYLVGRVLGQGGFGITYLGWDLNLDRKLAIKEFLPTALATRAAHGTAVTAHDSESGDSFRQYLDRFLDEGRILAKFQDHRGIVQVLNFFRENKTGYLVMAYVDGMNLKQYLARHEGRVPYAEALKIMTPVMEALGGVHAENLLHRDISPDNIYISDSGQVKLLDFGAARYAMGESQKTVSVVLKPGYAPPEQYYSRGNQGPWTDVYALAATLYHMLTGSPPSESPARADQDDLQLPRALGVAMPERAEAGLRKALSVRSEQRLRTMQDFQRELVAPEAGGMSSPARPRESGDQWQAADAAASDSAAKAIEAAAKLAGGANRAATSLAELARRKIGEIVATPRGARRLALAAVLALLLLLGLGWWNFTDRVDGALVGKWRAQFQSSNGPWWGAVRVTRGGDYELKSSARDGGQAQVFRTGVLTLQSSEGNSSQSQFRFESPDVVVFSGGQLGDEAGTRYARTSASSGVADLRGEWKSVASATPGWQSNRNLKIGKLNSYGYSASFVLKCRMRAEGGVWQMRCDGYAPDQEDSGTYSLIPGQENQVYFTGNNGGTTQWTRALE